MNQLTSQALPSAWIEKLFLKFSTLWGAKFLDQWRSVNPEMLKAAWAEDLAGYSGEELKRGVEACKGKTFPVTLPEFMQLCRPSIDAEAAYYEAVKQMQLRKDGNDSWTHRAIFWTASKIGSHDLQNSSWPTMRGRWTAIFTEVMAAGIWPEIPPHREALPAPGKSSISREEAAKRAEAIKSATTKLVSDQPGDKRWAAEILARLERGEKIPAAAEVMARSALA